MKPKIAITVVSSLVLLLIVSMTVRSQYIHKKVTKEHEIGTVEGVATNDSTSNVTPNQPMEANSDIESVIKPLLTHTLPTINTDEKGNERDKKVIPDEFDVGYTISLITDGIFTLAEEEETYYKVIINGNEKEKEDAQLMLTSSIPDINELALYTTQMDYHGGVITNSELASGLYKDLQDMWKGYLDWYNMRENLTVESISELEAKRNELIQIIAETDKKINKLDELYQDTILK